MLGIAFGLAAATLETWLNFVPVMERRFGGSPVFALRVASLYVAIGLVLGLAAAPLLLARAGRALHVLGMGLGLFALQRWVELEAPAFSAMVIVLPVGTTLLVWLGLGLSRWSVRAPWAAWAVAFAAGLAAPPVYLKVTTPAPPPAPALPDAPAGAPDVVLIVLDTVRAGSLSTYGYARPTAPTFDALAREGALFLDATSPSTWSLPSHASLFTGRYPSSHGAHAEHRFLDARYPTVAEVFEHNGYETFCFTANGWISDGLGLTRGFARQERVKGHGGAGLGFSFVHRLADRLGLQEADKGGAIVVDAFSKWAADRPADARPAFVFLNFIEAHFPYHQLPHEHLFRFTDRPYGELRSVSIDLLGQQFGGAGRPVEEAREPAVDMYDGGVEYTDVLLRSVVEALRARGSFDRTVLLVLADHGEVLGEFGGFFGHGPSLYQAAVGVPLLVRYPPAIPAGARVATPVSTLGAFATLVDLAGLAAPPTLQAGSLAPLARGDAASPGPILSELHDPAGMGMTRDRPDPQMKVGRRYRLLREGSLKLVVDSQGRELLYDLAADPEEAHDVAAERPDDLARMRARLAEAQATLGLPALDAPLAVGEQAPELDDATRERLRALGYAE